MAVYQYTLFKYLKSPSTWIVLILSMFIAGFLGGWLPFHVVAAHNKDSLKVYSMTIVGIVGAGASFLAIFVSVFAGFKVATMYKDEVEDGTFLIMLSKPKTRSRIIFEKWLALQTTMIVYSTLTIVSFMISIAVNDPGPSIIPEGSIISTLTSKIWTVSLVMLGVLIVIGFIFTSIALLLSTVVSAGSTIGITIALGVVIPITGMISTFTTNPKYPSMRSSKLEMSKSLLTAGIKEIETNANKISSFISLVSKQGSVNKEEIEKFITQLKTFTNEEIYGNINKVINGKDGLASLSMVTNNVDDFKKTHYFDLSYQIHSLGSLASDLVVPPEFAALTSDSKWGKLTGIPMTTKVIDANPFVEGAEYDSMLNDIVINIKPILSAAKRAQDILGNVGIVDYDAEYPWMKPVIKTSIQQYLASTGELDNVKKVIDLLHDMIVSPLYYVLDTEAINKLYDKDVYKFSTTASVSPNKYISDALHDEFFPNTESYEKEKYGFITPSFVFSQSERSLVNKLISIARHDDEYHTSSFVKVKKVPYANKFTILYIYLIIAVVLTPISFVVVKKQDFK